MRFSEFFLLFVGLDAGCNFNMWELYIKFKLWANSSSSICSLKISPWLSVKCAAAGRTPPWEEGREEQLLAPEATSSAKHLETEEEMRRWETRRQMRGRKNDSLFFIRWRVCEFKQVCLHEINSHRASCGFPTVATSDFTANIDEKVRMRYLWRCSFVFVTKL